MVEFTIKGLGLRSYPLEALSAHECDLSQVLSSIDKHLSDDGHPFIRGIENYLGLKGTQICLQRNIHVLKFITLASRSIRVARSMGNLGCLLVRLPRSRGTLIFWLSAFRIKGDDLAPDQDHPEVLITFFVVY